LLSAPRPRLFYKQMCSEQRPRLQEELPESNMRIAKTSGREGYHARNQHLGITRAATVSCCRTQKRVGQIGMTITHYTQYVRDLKTTIDQVREKPSLFERATIKLAICRNGYAYRSTERLQERSLVSEYKIGPVHSQALKHDDGTLSREEIEHFFKLPEVYAYSDLALTFDRSPLMNAHWDATIGLVDARVTSISGSAMRQRMLFIGFTDPVHAEFALQVDDALLVHNHRTGSQFFEWIDENCESPKDEMVSSGKPATTAKSEQRWSPLRIRWWSAGFASRQQRGRL